MDLTMGKAQLWQHACPGKSPRHRAASKRFLTKGLGFPTNLGDRTAGEAQLRQHAGHEVAPQLALRQLSRKLLPFLQHPLRKRGSCVSARLRLG